MEAKKWINLSSEEKERLLFHIYYYYNKTLISMKEIKDFKSLAKENPDSVYYALVGLFESGASAPTVFTCAMRANKLDDLLGIYNNMSESEKSRLETIADNMLNEEFLPTQNNPAPNIPMTEEQIVASIKNIKGNHR